MTASTSLISELEDAIQAALAGNGRSPQRQDRAGEKAGKQHDRKGSHADEVHLAQNILHVKGPAKDRGESLACQEGPLLHFVDGSFRRDRHLRHRSGKIP